MKDDNSCLFRSIGYCIARKTEESDSLRDIIVQNILADPTTYSEAMLDKKPLEYCEWILKPTSWWGAIELHIFAHHFGVGSCMFQLEICSVDIQTQRIDIFGQAQEYPQRILVLYSGIHYDVIAFTPIPDAPLEYDQTIFDWNDKDILLLAKGLAKLMYKVVV